MTLDRNIRIALIVVGTIFAVWLVSATIHRLAAIAAYVVVFGIGYLVGQRYGGKHDVEDRPVGPGDDPALRP